jgi:hypothetical protein
MTTLTLHGVKQDTGLAQNVAEQIVRMTHYQVTGIDYRADGARIHCLAPEWSVRIAATVFCKAMEWGVE